MMKNVANKLGISLTILYRRIDKQIRFPKNFILGNLNLIFLIKAIRSAHAFKKGYPICNCFFIIYGNSDLGLKIFKDVSEKDINQAKAFLKLNIIDIQK